MKNLIKSMLIIEFIACFSCITLLWVTGCFFTIQWIPGFFSGINNSVAGLLFLLWIIAGGVGLTGAITLLIHLIQSYSLGKNTRQLKPTIYMLVIIGIIANIILNFIFGDIWEDAITQITLNRLLVILIFNAPIICSLHFLWLNFRGVQNETKSCWIKSCLPKPQQT